MKKKDRIFEETVYFNPFLSLRNPFRMEVDNMEEE